MATITTFPITTEPINTANGVTGAGTTASPIQNEDNGTTNAHLSDMAAGTIKGNNTGGTTDPIDLTTAQVATMLPVASTTAQGMMPQLSGNTNEYLDGTGAWVAAAKNFQFADDTTVAPTTAGAPTLAEIQAFVTANTVTDAHVYYNGTDVGNVATATYVYKVDAAGVALQVYPSAGGSSLAWRSLGDGLTAYCTDGVTASNVTKTGGVLTVTVPAGESLSKFRAVVAAGDATYTSSVRSNAFKVKIDNSANGTTPGFNAEFFQYSTFGVVSTTSPMIYNSTLNLSNKNSDEMTDTGIWSVHFHDLPANAPNGGVIEG